MRYLALFLLFSVAHAQYPKGCSETVTMSGFNGCELGELHARQAEVKAAKNEQEHQLAVNKLSFFIQAMEVLHKGMMYQTASSIKNPGERKEFETSYPDGRLTSNMQSGKQKGAK